MQPTRDCSVYFNGGQLSVLLSTFPYVSGPLRLGTAFQGLKSSYCSRRLWEQGKKPAAPDALQEDPIINSWPDQKVARGMRDSLSSQRGPRLYLFSPPSISDPPPPPASCSSLPPRFPSLLPSLYHPFPPSPLNQCHLDECFREAKNKAGLGEEVRLWWWPSNLAQ